MSDYPSCPVCQNSQNNNLQDKLLQVFVCFDCGHVFSKKEVAVDEIYSPEYYLEEHKNWFLNPNLKLFSGIMSYIKSNFSKSEPKVLDIGCGRGDLLHFLHKHQPKWRLHGIDVTENKEEGITFIQGDFANYTFKQEFDIVIGLMVIEHVTDPLAFVKKIFSILSDHGHVFIVTINSNSIMYRLAKILLRLGWRVPYDRLYHHHHLQHFNNASLRRLLDQNGFSILKQRNHNFPLSAVDVPQASRFVMLVYRFVIAGLFAITNIFGGGVNQTIICKKNI